MEEAPENSKELSHSAYANGMNEKNHLYTEYSQLYASIKPYS